MNILAIKMKKHNFTDAELNAFDDIQEGLIIELFDCKDKGFAIMGALKMAYFMGVESKSLH